MPLAFSRRRQRIVPLLRTPRRSGAGRGTPRAAASLPRGATAAPRTAGPRAHRGLPAPPGDPQRAAAAQPQHVRGWKQGEGRTEPPAARAAGRKRPRAAQRERGAAPGAAASAANLRALASRRPAQLRAVPAPTCGGPHLHVGSPLLSLHPVRRPSLPVPHFSLGRARAGAAPGAGAVTPPQPRREDVAQRRAAPPSLRPLTVRRRPRFVPARSRRRPRQCLSRRGSAKAAGPSRPPRWADAGGGSAPPDTAPPRGPRRRGGSGPARPSTARSGVGPPPPSGCASLAGGPPRYGRPFLPPPPRQVPRGGSSLGDGATWGAGGRGFAFRPSAERVTRTTWPRRTCPPAGRGRHSATRQRRVGVVPERRFSCHTCAQDMSACSLGSPCETLRFTVSTKKA